MWDFTAKQAGEDREQRLKSEPQLWKTFVDLGSRVMRQDRDKVSAMEIVEYLIERKKPLTLDIQREMVDEEKELLETGAGSELATAWEKLIQTYENKVKELELQLKDTFDTFNKRDEERQRLLEERLKEYQEKINKNQDEIANLRINAEDLVEEAKKKYEEERLQLEEKHAQDLEKQKFDVQKNMREKYMKAMYGRGCTVM